MLVDLSAVGRVWAVIAVKPRGEAAAEAVLDRAELKSYCPRLKSVKRAGLNPLFPGYLFVWLSPAREIAQIRNLPFIRRPLLFKDQLACIREEQVEFWREREGGRGFLTPEPPSPFQPGQRVKLKEGAFRGFEGVVLETLSGRQRVKMLLEYLGGTLRLEVDQELLQ